MKALFLGLGYIGLPTAAVIANNGINVVGVDINPEIVDTINKGLIHIIEPNLDELVKKVVTNGNLKASLNVEKADVFFIVVPTPFNDNHKGDISFIKTAVEMILPFLEEGNLVILESTSPIKTTEIISDIIFSNIPHLKDKIYIAYCPERVLPGNVLIELVNNDRVIGGINESSTSKAAEFYSLFVKGQLHKTNSRTAEMCKLVENASRDNQIAFANELSMLCDEVDINVWELINLANKHPRVNILQPGCGVGGHCIAVDPWFIISDFPNNSNLIRKSREINDFKSKWCLKKIIESSNSFKLKNNKEPIIACMGLAFKPNIDDLRESPAKHIATSILADTEYEILVVEPNLHRHSFFNLVPYLDAYSKADIIVWLVKHDEFLTIPRIANKIEIDFCGVRK